jgi:hypothetical protein
MVIKAKDAFEVYVGLKKVKLNRFSNEAMIDMWKNMKTLKVIADEYASDIQSASESVADDKFNQMRNRLQELIEIEKKVKSGEVEGIDNSQEIDEINNYFSKYKEKYTLLTNEISNKEHNIEIAKIPHDEILNALRDGDFDFGFLDKISWILK